MAGAARRTGRLRGSRRGHPQDAADIPVAALCWGMSVATYPFFGKVAELVGRLSAIQGDCASAEGIAG